MTPSYESMDGCELCGALAWWPVGERCVCDACKQAPAPPAEREDDRKPVLTPEQEAEGWTVMRQGGMWIKTLDLSKLTLRACFNPDWQVRAEAAEARVRDLDAVALRLSTYIETLESANADLGGAFERAEAAEARVRELESAVRELDAIQASVEQGRFEVRQLQASNDRLLKISECATEEDARELVMEEFNRAEAAEAKLARLQARIDRNFVYTSDQLRALLEEP